MENQERPTVGHLLADIFMRSTPDTFNKDIQAFLNETAETLGGIIGSSCSDPAVCIIDFNARMVDAAYAEASKRPRTTKDSEKLAAEVIAKAASKH